MSVISLLNEPNTLSPANVDASVMFRDWMERKNTKYKEYVEKQARKLAIYVCINWH